MTRALRIALLAVLPLAAACSARGASPSVADGRSGVSRTDDASGKSTGSGVLVNHGGAMEGHTPRGFRGSGTGLFVGDNFNKVFPDGDGVQAFLSFDLGGLSGVGRAELRAPAARVTGTPFEDLGNLVVEAVRYDRFSPDLFDLEPTGSFSCVLATQRDGPFRCDVTEVVADAFAAGRGTVQFRVRFETAGDGDGATDVVAFNPQNMNENRPGLFELEITAP